MESPKEIFISYGRSPVVNAFVCRLRGDLEQNGFSVWLDLQDIHSGSDWHNAIGGGLYNCSAILPVITTKYLSSSYCLKELYTADGDRKLIFPIMYEDVDFDRDENSRGVKFTISSINWTMCRPQQDDYNTSVSNLVQHLREKGLGREDFKGPEHVKLGDAPSSQLADSVGPENTHKPVQVIPAEMPGGIATGSGGIVVYSAFSKASVVVLKGEDPVATLGCANMTTSSGEIDPNYIISPAGVAIRDNEILVASQYYLKRFSLDGQFLGQVGDLRNPSDSSLMGPAGMTIGAEGRIYVVETGKNRVKIFNSDLTFHKHFSHGDRTLGPGTFNCPMDVASDSQGRVYVADLSNNAIQVFSPDGDFLFRFGKQGHTLGCIQSPLAVAVDPQDHVYVAGGTGTIAIFEISETREANFIKAFGSFGAEQGQFSGIKSVHIDSKGKVYVAETGNHRIQVFA